MGFTEAVSRLLLAASLCWLLYSSAEDRARATVLQERVRQLESACEEAPR